jgi:hypothetical protein
MKTRLKLEDIHITTLKKKIVIPCAPECHCAKLQELHSEYYADELPDNDVRFGESPDY